MLAPKVQATTIEVRVPLALDKSQSRQELLFGAAMWGRVFDPFGGPKTRRHTSPVGTISI